jgi:DNA-directed RNA polymerase subunit L
MIRIVIEGDTKDVNGKIVNMTERLKGLYIYFNEYSHDQGNLLVSLLSKDDVVLSCKPIESPSDSTATCRWENVTFSYGPGKKPFPNIQQ